MEKSIKAGIGMRASIVGAILALGLPSIAANTPDVKILPNMLQMGNPSQARRIGGGKGKRRAGRSNWYCTPWKEILMRKQGHTNGKREMARRVRQMAALNHG